MNEIIKNKFASVDIEVKRTDLSKIVISKERLFKLIAFLGKEYEYKILNAITCCDWIEEEHFALTYIVSTLNRKHTIMIQTIIGRKNATIDTLSLEFPQANIMERDLHEMYGIDFVGHPNLRELSLENWIHTPPLRREFDTLEFVNENLTFREGRDDNVDTKAEAKRLRAIKKAQKKAQDANT